MKLVDILLPTNPYVERLLKMSPEELRQKVKTPINNLNENTTALFDYKDPLIRQAIWELKYRGNRKIVALFAECLHEDLVLELSNRRLSENFNNPLLLPIPISRERKRSRGFNQSELLAEALAKKDCGNFFEVNCLLLWKIKDAESQTKKNRAERLKNLNGCFAIKDPNKIHNRNIILLDDVTTTGATFEEARKTLLLAGAKKIYCVAVAH